MEQLKQYAPGSDATGEAAQPDNGTLQSEEAPSTALYFEDYQFENGTRTNFCFSQDGTTCETLLHAGIPYQVSLRVANAGETNAANFAVVFRLEPDGFYTTEEQFSSVERMYTGGTLPPGAVDEGVQVTLPPLQEGLHYNLKAWITVNDVPLGTTGADTAYNDFTVAAADTTEQVTDENQDSEEGSGEEQQETIEESGEISANDGGTVAVSIDLLTHNDAELRAFFPTTRDQSGRITLRAEMSNLPAGATLQWSCSNPAAVHFLQPDSASTEVEGVLPGRWEVSLSVLNGGQPVQAASVTISVPQFVLITEDAAKFDSQLEGYVLLDRKQEVIEQIRQTVDYLLSRANVRTVWQISPFQESLPGHLPATSCTVVTIEDQSDPGLLGVTWSPSPTKYDERIQIFPGGYKQFGPDVTQVIVDVVNRINADAVCDDGPVYRLWIKVMSRLIGETIAHEITHSLFGFFPGSSGGHNTPAIPFDIINQGGDREFSQRTGIEVFDYNIFPAEGTYLDHGDSASEFTPSSQSRIDQSFPVPPAL